MKKVAIIDYQLSNLCSVKAACDEVGLDARITSNIDEILNSDAAILPGVGSFGPAMHNLKKMGLDDAIKRFIKSKKHFFGVCLGLQLLFESSEEFGFNRGLGILKGKVNKFSPKIIRKGKYPVPHVGWSKIYRDKNNWKETPLSNCRRGEYMYFVHSYYVEPQDQDVILSVSTYGEKQYCSSVKKGNIFATQFHPEKSGKKGLLIYSSFKSYIEKNE